MELPGQKEKLRALKEIATFLGGTKRLATAVGDELLLHFLDMTELAVLDAEMRELGEPGLRFASDMRALGA